MIEISDRQVKTVWPTRRRFEMLHSPLKVSPKSRYATAEQRASLSDVTAWTPGGLCDSVTSGARPFFTTFRPATLRS